MQNIRIHRDEDEARNREMIREQFANVMVEQALGRIERNVLRARAELRASKATDPKAAFESLFTQEVR